MSGILYTYGNEAEGTHSYFEGFDAIRNEPDYPTDGVRLLVTDGGVLDLSDELGSISVSVRSAEAIDLTTGAGGDALYGSEPYFYDPLGRQDTLRGGDGNDTLYGAGRDSLYGGNGDDTFQAGHRTSGVIDGGAGYDVLFDADLADLVVTGVERLATSYGSVSGTMAQLEAFDSLAAWNSGTTAWDPTWLMGVILTDGGMIDLSDELGAQAAGVRASAFGNTIITGSGNDALLGGAGTDRLYSGFGDDSLSGGTGADTLSGGAGNDTLKGGDGSDTLDGGTGTDRLEGGAGNDIYLLATSGDAVVEASGAGTDLVKAGYSFTLGTDVENLQITGLADLAGTGNSLSNRMTGNSGANILKGLGGSDILDGGAGHDRLEGGAGNDTYVLATTGDTVVEAVGAGVDLIKAAYSLTLGANVENLELTGTLSTSGTGNTLANRLTGNGVANILKGMGGSDNLSGGAGNDRLEGGAGNDVLAGGGGLDKLYGGTGTDILDGGAGADSFYFRRGDGRDMVKDLANNADTIFVDDALWGGGAKTAAQILAYAKVSNGDAVFDFRNGNVLTVDNVTDLRIFNDDLAWF